MDADPLDGYPRPWFYRPEFYIPFFIFPPVWSVLTLRSPWNSNVLMGGVAWFLLALMVVLAFNWGYRQGNWHNLFLFLPGVLLTVVTQVQWQAHLAQHGPPPAEDATAANPLPPPATDSKEGQTPRRTARRRPRRRRPR